MNKKCQPTTMISECKVCGESAKYTYYGAIVCEPCKKIFKRNAEKGQEILKCDFDGHCEININNRHVCSYCRLIKCFVNGMETVKIQLSYLQKNKTSEKRKQMDEVLEIQSKALGSIYTSSKFNNF